MNKELQIIIKELENTLDGQPWFGRSVYTLLGEVDEAVAFKKPNDASHSLIDLVYHMLTWADFTLKRVQKEKIVDMEAFDKMDWREIDPKIHNWDEALGALVATHQELLAVLNTKADSFLNEKVDYREYDFRFLLNGLIQHNIYHAGQVAYLAKLLG